MKPRLAPALKKSDTVRLIAPASSFEPARLRLAVSWLEKRGYRARMERGIFSKEGYLAGGDGRRFGEFQRAWSDRTARAVFAARGGYGTLRLLGKRALVSSKASPKIFMGLSDLTVLLNHIAASTGIVTVHGPVMAGDSFLALSPARRNRLFRYLEKPEERVLQAPVDYLVFSSGIAKGRLWGGNLSMVAATIGTPYRIPFSKGLLFLEEVNEAPYRVDRLFAQLNLSGALRDIRGLLLGDFLDPNGNPFKPAVLCGIVKRHLEGRRIPVLVGIHAGHRRNDVWLPIGSECAIEMRGERLRLSPLVGS